MLFRLIYVAMVFIGPYLTFSAVWGIADIMNGLMAFPNLIALVLLSPVVVGVTREYLDKTKNGERLR
jgi:AGCS family alanine or glycine:cation symporter